MSSTRSKLLIAAILDEVVHEAKGTKAPKIKEGDNVVVIRGALTGYSGEVTFLSPCLTLADVKFENGRVGRVPTVHLKKQKQKKNKDVKAGF